MKVKRLFLISALILCITTLSGCVKTAELNEEELNNTYVFISKNVQNGYMQKLYQGFNAACNEAGVSALYKAPVSYSAQEQIDIVEEMIESGVKGIAIAANDAYELDEVLQKAMNSGVKVVSVDSAVNAVSRQTHIQQADPEKIGKMLMSSAYDSLGGQGGIAILSSTEHATNQNLWIEYMKKEVENNPEKYASTPIIEIAYGDDDMTKSTVETQRILENPQIKAVIAPTAVGIIAAAGVIRDSESSVKLVGLGMPSQMADFIEDGTCQRMYLWNPVDIGYLAAYALNALDSGQLTGAEGETFTAGVLGDKTVTMGTDGGTEVMLGDLVEFNKDNIGEWRNAF